MLGEIRTMSGQVSQSISIGLKNHLRLLEDNLSQNITNSTRSIETTVSQSSTAVSQSIVAEIGQMLPAMEVSVVNSVAQQIDNSSSFIEATIANLSLELKSALDTYAVEQMTALSSILKANPEARKRLDLNLELLKLPVSGPSLPRMKRKKRDRHLARQKSFSCKCGPNIGCIDSIPSFRWGLSKKKEAFVIHKRSCPLWYQTQITTEYNVNLLFLQRLRIFGSLSITKSLYTSIFGWQISQTLTCKPVVPCNAPAFRVLTKHLDTPSFRACEDYITNCSQDLKEVFQSGQGSPHDTLTDGTTLIEVRLFFSPWQGRWRSCALSPP
jgi:hypothetical protein